MASPALIKQRDDFYDISLNWLPLIGHRKPQIIRNVVSPCKTHPKRFKNVKNPKIILNHRDLLFFAFADFVRRVGSPVSGSSNERRGMKRLTEHLTLPEFWWIVSIRNYPTCVFLTPQYRSLFKVKMWKNCLETSSASFRAAFRFPQSRVSQQFQRFRECV